MLRGQLAVTARPSNIMHPAASRRRWIGEIKRPSLSRAAVRDPRIPDFHRMYVVQGMSSAGEPW